MYNTAEGVIEALRKNEETSILIHVSFIDTWEFNRVVAALAVNKSVKWLRLSDCGVTDDCARVLAQAIAHHPKLQEFIVGSNPLSARGAAALVRAAQHTHITSISFDFCNINCDGIEELAAAVAATSLKRLNFNDNRLGNEGAVAIAEVLPLTNLRWVGFVRNGIMARGFLAIAAAIESSRFLHDMYCAEPIDDVFARQAIIRANARAEARLHPRPPQSTATSQKPTRAA